MVGIQLQVMLIKILDGQGYAFIEIAKTFWRSAKFFACSALYEQVSAIHFSRAGLIAIK